MLGMSALAFVHSLPALSQSSKELKRDGRKTKPTGSRRARKGAGRGSGGGGLGGGDDGEGPLDPTQFKSREFLDSDDDTSSEVIDVEILPN